MVVVEFENDSYGKIMKYITCIEEKAKEVKELLEEDVMRQRKPMRDDRDYEERKYRNKYEW